MLYFEVLVADATYKGDTPLTYSSENNLQPGNVVTIPFRNRRAYGVIFKKVKKPTFATKQIKSLVSEDLMPPQYLKLAEWMGGYYQAPLGEVLRQFVPTSTAQPRIPQLTETHLISTMQLSLKGPLTNDQSAAIKTITGNSNSTFLLHGNTGTGKTRVYLELAKVSLQEGLSVLLLTPEIALTAQLKLAAEDQLEAPIVVIHSQMSIAQRKKIWLEILGSKHPIVVIGPRSALFVPIPKIGLIVLDEAHEPAYKQESSPYYHAARVASQLAFLSGGKAILGTATPSIVDYYVANQRKAVINMNQIALKSGLADVEHKIIDCRERSNFSLDPHLSNPLIEEIKTTLSAKKQILIYLNRRGSARVILCQRCGWQLLCPNCDVNLVYHGDNHTARCHLCGFVDVPPANCPKCQSPDIVYRSIGTKALSSSLSRLFPNVEIRRFDSDSLSSERIHEVYPQVRDGKVSIIIGTQLLAKGFDLPRLGLVGIVAADSSLAIPDYTAEERTFQLLYQVMGRVGRGHGHGKVIIQTYNPDSEVIKAAVKRDYQGFYQTALAERKQFRFPPFSYLLKLTCRRNSYALAEKTALKLKKRFLAEKLAIEIIGPTASFYGRRGDSYYYQLIVKSKNRTHLLHLSKLTPAGWMIDIDPVNLL